MSAKPPEHQRLLGAALRAARKSRGVSRDVVATALGVKECTIGRYERGDTTQPVTAFANVCGVTARHLLLAAAQIQLPVQ